MKKKIIIILVMILSCFILTNRVNASVTEQWATKQVKIQTCNGDGECSWTSNYDANHNFTGSDLSYPVTALEWRLKATNGLSVENTYTFSFGYKPTPDAIMYDRVFMRRGAAYADEDITCTNTLDNSYYMWTCTFSPREDYSSSQWLYVQVKFYQAYLTGLNTKISAFEERQGISSVVTQQTTIINDTLNDILDKDYTYSNNADETITGQSQFDSYNNKETQLFDSLDYDMSSFSIGINTFASAYIWHIVNELRTMSVGIVTLMTSVLSLGIIKMILNR